MNSVKWTTRQIRFLLIGFCSGCGTLFVGAFVCVGYLLLYGPGILVSDYDGYKLNWEPSRYRLIRKDDEIIVRPAVIEHDAIGTYVIGLRLPVQEYDCGGGQFFDLINERRYFILSTVTGAVLEFDSTEAFEVELRRIGIFDDMSLDYSMFYYMAITYPSKYNSIDYPECVPVGART